MAERFWNSEKPLVLNQPGLEQRLKEYPELKAKIETMLAIIENAGGDAEKAAEAVAAPQLNRHIPLYRTSVGHSVSARATCKPCPLPAS